MHEPIAEELGRRPVGDGTSIAQGAQPARARGEAPGRARPASWGARHSATSDPRQTQDSLLFPSTQTRGLSSDSHRDAPGSRESLAEMNMAGSLRSSNPPAGVNSSAEPLPLQSRQMIPPSIDTHALQHALVRQHLEQQEAHQLPPTLLSPSDACICLLPKMLIFLYFELWSKALLLPVLP
jgi:hypothetical protein